MCALSRLRADGLSKVYGQVGGWACVCLPTTLPTRRGSSSSTDIARARVQKGCSYSAYDNLQVRRGGMVKAHVLEILKA